MFATADVNSFYASCERVFRPDLKGKPVVVLNNNDGCVIAKCRGKATDQNGYAVVSDEKRKIPGKNIRVLQQL